VGSGLGYLVEVRAWRRFGFGAAGNLIIYDDRFVLAAFQGWERLDPLATRSRYERLAQQQLTLSPDTLAAGNSRSWAVRLEDISSARCHTSGGASAQSGGDSVVDVVLNVAAAANDAFDCERVLTLVIAGTHGRYPSIKGRWGNTEGELLKRVLGDKLVGLPHDDMR
jgi:hypothetical protein